MSTPNPVSDLASRGESDAYQEEAALVAALKAGEEAAYAELVRRYGGRLLAAANRLLRDRAAAEDCVQEAFLNAFRAIDRFEERAMLSSWLHRIVVNAALMRLRRRTPEPEEAIEALQPVFDANGERAEEPLWTLPEPEAALAEGQLRKIVREKIDALPENYRTVLMLRDIEEMSGAEAAEALGITEGAVKVRLHRARAALKRLLEPVYREELR